MHDSGFSNIQKYSEINWEAIFTYSEASPSGLAWKYDRWRGNVKTPYIHRHAGSTAGSINAGGYYVICMHVQGTKYMWQVHRIVYEMHHGKIVDAKMAIDHIDGDVANNRIANLRLVSRATNARNAVKYSNNTSGVVGVYLEPAANRVKACWMGSNGKLKSKTFNTNKLGSEEAFRQACSYRKSMIAEMNELGAGYTNRHGT